jgi:hypothetical protein
MHLQRSAERLDGIKTARRKLTRKHAGVKSGMRVTPAQVPKRQAQVRVREYNKNK